MEVWLLMCYDSHLTLADDKYISYIELFPKY